MMTSGARASHLEFGFRISFGIRNCSFVIHIVIPTAEDHQSPLASDMQSFRTGANPWKIRKYRVFSAEPVPQPAPIAGTLRPTVGTRLPGSLSACNSPYPPPAAFGFLLL